MARIAINTRFLLPKKMEGFGWYTFEIVRRLIQNHPEHTFVLFFDRPIAEQFRFTEKNVEFVVLNPPARHPILFIIWFEWAVYRALKKYKIDLFFSPDGYLSLRSKTPQVNVIHDINFEHFPKDIPLVPRLYLRCFFSKFAKKSQKIITVSKTSKEDIAKTYKVNSDKIIPIWNGVSEIFKPISREEKIEIERHYSNGKNYFLFVGSIHPRKNLQNLILAFEHYKKHLKGNFEMVIVGEEMWSKQSFQIDEKIKNHIHFTGHLPLDKLAKVMSGATVFTFLSYFEGFGIPLVEAMRSGVPILASNTSCIPEIAGEAALYSDPFDIVEISEKMLQLEKDEQLRNELIQKGLERGQLFSWDLAAREVWEVISSVV